MITNDDSIAAPGLHHLVECVRDMADVIVVAPAHPHSGQSSALTVGAPLKIKELEQKHEGVRLFTVGGTPVDCVKLGLHTIVPRKPDMLLSGINHGSNSGTCITYSGTMGAVLEGCMQHIPSVGFSLLHHSMRADFSLSTSFVKGIAANVLEKVPVQLAGCGGSSANYTREKDGGGIFDLSFYEVNLQGSKGSGAPEVKDAVFRLRRNGDVAVEQTAKYGETIENYTCDPEKGLIAEAGMGDEFTLSFFCRDTSGLGYEFDLEQWSIGESGIAREHGPEDFWPKLTWD